MQLVQSRGELVGEAQPLRDHPELFIRVQIGFGEDHAEHRFRQAQIGQHAQIALLPRLDVVELVGVDIGDLDIQRLEYLDGDVVVDGRRRIRDQQTATGGARPQDDEELVIDIQQSEDRAGAAQCAQLVLGRRQAAQCLDTERGAFPCAVLTDNRHCEPFHIVVIVRRGPVRARALCHGRNGSRLRGKC